MRSVNKQSKVTLVELPAYQGGVLNGELSRDVYSRINLPARATHVLEGILREGGWVDVRTLNPKYHGAGGMLTPENLRRIFSSDVLGISAITRTSPQSITLADMYKKANPNGVVVAGGADPTGRVDDWLNHVDFVVRGEGEVTFSELMARLASGERDFGDISGLSFRKNGEKVHNVKRNLMTPQELSELPHPYYDEETKRGVFASVVETSRGCPWDCDFCSVTQTYGRKYRNKSSAYVMDEFRRLNGVGKVRFLSDDNFAGNEKQTMNLARAIEENGLGTNGGMQAQVTVRAAGNLELLRALRRIGIDTLYNGYESTSDETLVDLNKPFRLKDNTEAAGVYREMQFWVHGMMMPGGDGDTLESLRGMLEWAKTNLDSVQFFPPTPLPGTRFYERMQREGRILTDDFSLYDAQHVVIRPKNFSPAELQETIYGMYEDFYSVSNCARRLTRNPRFLSSLGVMAYIAFGGVKKVLYDKQSIRHLDFLRAVS